MNRFRIPGMQPSPKEKAGTREGSWRDLFSRAYLPRLITLALALWLHASNSMLTATTMPSAVDEIGGLELISWTFALYLAGSIAAAASISLLVARFGLKKTMMQAALVFTGGCVLVALAPNMPLLLVGRILQGIGGGGLLPEMWPMASRLLAGAVGVSLEEICRAIRLLVGRAHVVAEGAGGAAVAAALTGAAGNGNVVAVVSG